MHLGHVIEADGRWRLFVFADPTNAGLDRLCHDLERDPRSPVRRYSGDEADIDAVLDVRAVVQQAHQDVVLGDMPALLHPTKGRNGLVDYEKVFCPKLALGVDVFEMRGIDRSAGAMVLVRPDQHVAHVLPLDGYGELAAFFEGFMIPTV